MLGKGKEKKLNVIQISDFAAVPKDSIRAE